jgi:DNA-binding MarR family transcriptional regulator
LIYRGNCRYRLSVSAFRTRDHLQRSADVMQNSMPETCSCLAVRQAARHMTRLYDDALSSAGITLNQYSILAKLDRLGPKILQDLAAALVMDRSTLGHLLRPLEERGLVACEASNADRRQRVVVLTGDGATLLKSTKKLWAKAEARFEHAFGQANALGLRAMMRQITTVEFGAGQP